MRDRIFESHEDYLKNRQTEHRLWLEHVHGWRDVGHTGAVAKKRRRLRGSKAVSKKKAKKSKKASAKRDRVVPLRQSAASDGDSAALPVAVSGFSEGICSDPTWMSQWGIAGPILMFPPQGWTVCRHPRPKSLMSCQCGR